MHADTINSSCCIWHFSYIWVFFFLKFQPAPVLQFFVQVAFDSHLWHECTQQTEALRFVLLSVSWTLRPIIRRVWRLDVESMKLTAAQIEAPLSVVFNCSSQSCSSSLGIEHCNQDRKILEFNGMDVGPKLHFWRKWLFGLFVTGMFNFELMYWWNLCDKIHSQSWSKMPSKLLSCVGLLYKVVQKIDCFLNYVLCSFSRIDLNMG